MNILLLFLFSAEMFTHNKSMRRLLLLFCAVLILGHQLLLADSLTLPVSADSFLRATQADNGRSSRVILGTTVTPNDALRSVLAFQLDHYFLEGAIIHSVELQLRVSERDTYNGGSVDQAVQLDLHVLDADFEEDEVDWFERTSRDNWMTPGGDYQSVIASVVANPGTVNAGDLITLSSEALTEQTINSLQGDGSLNLLCKLADEGGSRSVFRFNSFESGPLPIALVIDYTPVGAEYVTPIPGHPEDPISSDYAVYVGGVPVEVRSESFGFDVAMFTLASHELTVQVDVGYAFDTFELLPARHGLVVEQDGSSLRFQISEPHRLVLEISGGQRLLLLVTPPEVDVPSPEDPDVRYFAAGVHDVGLIQPLSGETIYLAPGALVKGRIAAVDVSDVTIRGRGILETEDYCTRTNRLIGILFERTDHIQVEGIGVRSMNTFWQTLFLNTTDALVQHVNIMGFGLNTDGLDIDAVKDFTVRDSFIRAGDDCLGWHALSAEDNGEMITEHVLADNIVIWNEAGGNGVRIGASMEAQLWRDVTLRNLDILWHSGAGLYSDFSDWLRLEDLRFENIYIRKRFPIDFAIVDGYWSNSTGFLSERGQIDGLLFENVTMDDWGINFAGFDATHRINAVRFNNCTKAGVPLTSLTQININEFVTDVQFNQPLPDRVLPDDGFYEFESLESKTAKYDGAGILLSEHTVPQYIVDDATASNGLYRVVQASGAGDSVAQTVDVTTSKAHDLKVIARTDPKSAQVQLYLNDNPLGAVVDLYRASPDYLELEYGALELDSGTQRLRFEVVGKNPLSAAYDVGLDSFELLTPLYVWRASHFGTTSGLGLGGDLEDPDVDGLPNLLEFAFGTSPNAADASVYHLNMDGAGRMTFPRVLPATLNYRVESNRVLSDAEGWLPIAELEAGSDAWTGSALVAESALGVGIELVEVSLDIDTIEDSQRFYRLSVSAP
jgi:hypothetical protein